MWPSSPVDTDEGPGHWVPSYFAGSPLRLWVPQGDLDHSCILSPLLLLWEKWYHSWNCHFGKEENDCFIVFLVHEAEFCHLVLLLSLSVLGSLSMKWEY